MGPDTLAHTNPDTLDHTEVDPDWLDGFPGESGDARLTSLGATDGFPGECGGARPSTGGLGSVGVEGGRRLVLLVDLLPTCRWYRWYSW